MRGMIMPSGKIKWFNAKKGYGFITDDETQKEVLFDAKDGGFGVFRGISEECGFGVENWVSVISL